MKFMWRWVGLIALAYHASLSSDEQPTGLPDECIALQVSADDPQRLLHALRTVGTQSLSNLANAATCQRYVLVAIEYQGERILELRP